MLSPGPEVVTEGGISVSSLGRRLIWRWMVRSRFSTFRPKGQTAEQIPQLCPR
jgi:hypothetical protein